MDLIFLSNLEKLKNKIKHKIFGYLIFNKGGYIDHRGGGFLGLVSVAALIAALNSPAAQKDIIAYLSFIERGIYTLALNLRSAAKEMVTGTPQEIILPSQSNTVIQNYNAYNKAYDNESDRENRETRIQVINNGYSQ